MRSRLPLAIGAARGRHRFKQRQPLEERLAQDTAQLREKAEVLPPGATREQIMRRITQNEAASDL